MPRGSEVVGLDAIDPAGARARLDDGYLFIYENISFKEIKGLKYFQINRLGMKRSIGWLFIMLILILDIASLSFYLSGGTNIQKERTGIVLGYYPYDWEIGYVDFNLVLQPEKNIVYLKVGITYCVECNFSFMMSLPYRIKSMSESSFHNDSGKWYFKNAETGSVVLFKLFLKEPDSGYDYLSFSSIIKVKDKIAIPNYGSYNIDVPFGGGFTYDVQEKWEEFHENVPRIGDGAPCSLQIKIKSSSVILGNTHKITRKDGVNNHQILYFTIDKFEPFFLQYMNPQKSQLYTLALFLFGLCCGILSSFLVEIMIKKFNMI